MTSADLFYAIFQKIHEEVEIMKTEDNLRNQELNTLIKQGIAEEDKTIHRKPLAKKFQKSLWKLQTERHKLKDDLKKVRRTSCV